MGQVPDLDGRGFATFYGVQVAWLGEDDEWMVALGHHEPRYAAAAFAAMCRDMGWSGLGEAISDRSPTLCKVAELLDHDQAVLLTDRCATAYLHPDGHDDGDCSTCDYVRETAKTGDWYMAIGCSEDDPDAFPVTVLPAL